MIPKYLEEKIFKFFGIFDSMYEIDVEIPKGFMNLGVTVNNNLIGDTNDSANWDTFSFPLPKPRYRWHIKRPTEWNYKTITLIDKI